MTASAPQYSTLLEIVGRELSAERDFPALAEQTRVWAQSRPLDGMDILDGTPVFMNTVAKYAALSAAGAKITAIASGDITFDPRMPAVLESAGIHFMTELPRKQFDFVMDCAGVCRSVPAKYGYTELTRSGIHLYEQDSVRRTVFAADSGRIKAIETVLGTGDGCVRAMLETRYNPAGKLVLLLGHGRVGRGIEFYLKRVGAQVRICDPAQGLPFTPSMLDGVWCVISATGIHHAHNSIAKTLAGSDAILINMGATDEYGPDMPESRVLYGKKSFNFQLKEPTQTRYIDSTLALHNAGTVWMLRHPGCSGMISPPRELEEAILAPVHRAGLLKQEIEALGL